MTQSSGPFRVGVDIGGTFTDLILVDEASGAFSIGKTLTTPADPSQGVAQVLADTLERAGLPASAVAQIVHGTTLVTNALIERRGAPTALLATAGFRDSIEIGREHRYELYDLLLEHPRPLVPRYLRFDVPERTLADGSVQTPLDEAFVARLARELEASGIEAVAIAFLHSFTNPAHERAARAVVQAAAPALRVAISSDVAPAIREFERSSTTVANVYVQARVERYLRELEARLAELGFAGSFVLMLSSGGTATVETAARYPIRLLESGPAAGALAAASYGRASGHADLLSFDMGGTTAKLCVIARGEPLLAPGFEVDRIYHFKKGSGLPISVPVIELIEIGTGGGSLARIDSLGTLKIGPQSSGAEPGPVCYGRGGTTPTVTDADLVLGYLDPAFFLGGKLALNREAAAEAIATQIAAPLGLSLEQAAWGMHQLANEQMANAARVHAMERGKDPRGLPLFCFGGAGPVHAYRVAKALGASSLIAPRGAGVMSAVGFLVAPLAFDFVRSWVTPLDGLDWARANTLLAELQAEGEALLAEAGVPLAAMTHRRSAEMRYVGQGHEIRVDLPDGPLGPAQRDAILAAFERVYRELYERGGPPVPVELITWRVVSRGPTPGLQLQVPRTGASDANLAGKGVRQAYFPETGFHPTPVYDRYRLGVGASFDGPAIVEERESTLVIGPGARCRVDAEQNIVVLLY